MTCMLNEKQLEHLHKHSLPLVRTPEDRAALIHASEVVQRSQDNVGGVPEQRLREVLEAIVPLLSAKGYIVRSYGASWLWQLAVQHEAAAGYLREAMASRHARTRLIIVQYAACTLRTAPLTTLLEKEVLRSGLRDRSMAVRQFSADRISGRIYLDLLGEVERAIAAESHPVARLSLEHCQHELAHGYIISPPRPERGDEVHCWIRVRGASCGVSIPEGLVEQVGLAELVRRARVRIHDRTISGERFDPLPPGYENEGRWPESVVSAASRGSSAELR